MAKAVCLSIFLLPNASNCFVMQRPIPISSQKTSSIMLSSQDHNVPSPSQQKLDLTETESSLTPLSMPVDKLGSKLKGRGRALTAWDCYRIGIDPLHFFRNDVDSDCDFESSVSDVWDQSTLEILKQTIFNSHGDRAMIPNSSTNEHPFFTDRNRIVDKYMPMKRKDIHSKVEGKGMGHKALSELSDLYPNALGLEFSIATLISVRRSKDGTVKLLLKLNNARPQSENKENIIQNYYIESVIIPWYKRSNPTSTLCISSQVGCAQGCTFCATVS